MIVYLKDVGSNPTCQKTLISSRQSSLTGHGRAKGSGKCLIVYQLELFYESVAWQQIKRPDTVASSF